MSVDNYNEKSVNATVARIETKLDYAINALTEQNRRLTILEVAENKRVGALVALGTICSAIGGGFVALVEFFKK